MSNNIKNTNLIPPSPQINVNTLRPFTRFCVSIGMIPSSYKASLTYEEQLMWLCKYLEETIIPAVNNNGEAVSELQELYIELKNYVDNYFTNLDVQEEINNKLDQMVEDGDFDEILFYAKNIQKIYNTTIDLLNSSEEFIVNQKIKTLGYYSLNDFGGAEFIISNIQNDNEFQLPLNNNLFATLINNDYNILKFGAKIDDNTFDNSTIINKLINLFGKVYFPKGNYYCSNFININKNNIQLIGDYAHILYNGNGYFIRTANEQTNNLYINKLKFYGNNQNNNGIDGSITDFNINNSDFRDFNIALRIHESWDGIFTNCRIHNNKLPMEFGNQANNIQFNSCYISSFTQRNNFNNCEGILFNSCDITNNTSSGTFYCYQSGLTFLNCYFENLSQNNTISCGYNESLNVLSNIIIIGGNITDDHISIIPQRAYVSFDNIKRGSIHIRPTTYVADPAAVSPAIRNLKMPDNYYANYNNALFYFDNGIKKGNLERYLRDNTQVIENGLLKITIPTNSSNVSAGFQIDNLEIGKDYLIIMEACFDDDTTNIVFNQSSNSYSVSRDLKDNNFKLILPFIAFGESLILRYNTNQTLNIKKLIVQEPIKYC